MNQALTLKLDININKENFCLNAKANIHWQQAGIHVIFAHSGCGKTHLLRAIAGFENVQGSITFQGETWLDSQQKINIPCHQRDIAFVFQGKQLFTHLNVRDNLMFAFKRSRANQQDLRQCIAALKLESLLDKKIHMLSGGEKQRVALARSLLSKPKLLLMDEPLASLDWQSKQEILPYIQKICHDWQLPILYVTHSLDEMMALATDVLILDKEDNQSRIKSIGPLIEILQDVKHEFNQSDKAGSIIRGQLLTRDSEHGLQQVKLDKKVLYIAKQSHLNHGPIRLRIQASDVSLCLSPASDSSILNILPATILEIEQNTATSCLIKLALDGQVILSRISRHSMERLKLKVDLALYVQIKAVVLQQGQA